MIKDPELTEECETHRQRARQVGPKVEPKGQRKGGETDQKKEPE